MHPARPQAVMFTRRIKHSITLMLFLKGISSEYDRNIHHPTAYSTNLVNMSLSPQKWRLYSLLELFLRFRRRQISLPVCYHALARIPCELPRSPTSVRLRSVLILSNALQIHQNGTAAVELSERQMILHKLFHFLVVCRRCPPRILRPPVPARHR